MIKKGILTNITTKRTCQRHLYILHTRSGEAWAFYVFFQLFVVVLSVIGKIYPIFVSANLKHRISKS